MSYAVELPPPRDWQVFEDLCRDLFAAEWIDPETQKHGRPGQKQQGVDIVGRRGGRWQAVQCKRRSIFPEKKLTEQEIRAEVKAAGNFAQPLETLVIATTAPPDSRLQALARQLTEEHGADGPRIVIYGWTDLCTKLVLHDDVLQVWQPKLLRVASIARPKALFLTAILASVLAVFGSWLIQRASTARAGSVYRVQVAALDPHGQPTTEGVKLSSFPRGQIQEGGSGWEIVIPSALKTKSGRLTVWAKKPMAFLSGKEEISLGEDLHPTLAVELKLEEVEIRGRIVNEANQGIPEATVFVEAYDEEGVKTGTGGGFVLPAHAADGQLVRLRAEADGFRSVEEVVLAGEKAVTILLEEP